MKKIFNILSFKQKKIFLTLIFLSLIISALEFFVLLTIQPIIIFFSNSSTAINPIFKYLSNYININIFNFFIIFFIIFIFKTLFSIYLSLKKNKFIKNVNDHLSKIIFSQYLNKKYEFFLNSNSSKFIANLIIEVEKFSYRVLDSMLVFVVELSIILSVIFFLFYTYFKITFFLIGFLLLFFYIFIKIFKNKLQLLGNQKVISDEAKISDLQKSFFTIQNIKIDNLENFFVGKFIKNNNLSSEKTLILHFLLDLPKPIMEILILFLVSISFYFFYYYYQISKSEILTMLALFIISMFRVLPSFNRILASFNSIRFNYSTINNINEEIISYKESLLTQRDKIIINNIDFKKNIVLENIFFSFPNNKKNILQDINLTINKGNYIGLVGDSGSGKSTLLNILCGLINPISGYVKVDGRFVRDNLKSFQKKIGYVPQKIYLTDDTFDKNIVLGVDKANFNNDLLGKVIVQSKLENVINNFSEGIHTKIGEYGSRLSGGQQQRIGIARALYKQPEIIIFDEATSALDPKVEEDILDTIYGLKNNITVIIVSHKDSVMSRCDHVYKLDNGRLLKI